MGIMRIGKTEFDLKNKSYIMGILNVTPDSFSDGGKYSSMDQALFQAEKMIREGAAIVDLGGESTRPGHIKVTDQEEIERVVPIIEAIKARFETPVSLDTYKVNVARAGINAGVDLINDIWGLQWDEKQELARLIAESGLPCCLMHNRKNMEYQDFARDFSTDIQDILQTADQAGIARDKIILDPGIGFAKTFEQNLYVMNHLELMGQWNLPWLLGTSRKSMIGLALDLPVDQREEGTMATTVMGRMKGASIFRVHDVQKNLRALQMTDAILLSE